MKADPSTQRRLLELQELDTRAAQIAHRRAKLPEAAEYATAAGKLEDIDTELVRARTEASDIQRDVAKAEADVQLVRDRAARNRSRLDAGQGSSKDLQALQHEIDSLARRQSVLEDEELVIMERAETVDAEVAKLAAYREELAATAAQKAQARDAALATLDEEQAGLDGRRGGIADGVGDELLALYEKIRAQTGMGAAEVRQRRCEGCRLELLGADLRRVTGAAPDDVVRCEECRRILVRTDESGL